jgi:hypothetical protein
MPAPRQSDRRRSARTSNGSDTWARRAVRSSTHLPEEPSYSLLPQHGCGALMSEFDSERLEKALSGDAAALRATVDQMTPVVRARVTRSLGRRLGFRAPGFEDEVNDLTQEVFVTLFTSDARALRAWDPGRGLSFLNFVGLLAQHRAAQILRTNRWLYKVQEQPLMESAASHAPRAWCRAFLGRSAQASPRIPRGHADRSRTRDVRALVSGS